MWKYTILLAIVLMLGSSCAKKCTTTVYPYLPPDFESYFASYKAGSWWVYEDSTGRYTDTSRVTEYTRSGGGPQSVCDGNNNTPVNTATVETVYVGITFALMDKIDYNLVAVTNDSASNLVEDETAYSSSDVFESKGKYSGDIGKFNILDSMTVSGVTYKKVLSCQLGYLAPGIGIIQAVYNPGFRPYNMHLKAYHIVH